MYSTPQSPQNNAPMHWGPTPFLTESSASFQTYSTTLHPDFHPYPSNPNLISAPHAHLETRPSSRPTRRVYGHTLTHLPPPPPLNCPVRPLRRLFPFTALYRGHRCGQPCKFLTSNAWPRLLSTKKTGRCATFDDAPCGETSTSTTHPKLSACTGIFVRVWANTRAHESQTPPFPCTGIFPAPRQTP